MRLLVGEVRNAAARPLCWVIGALSIGAIVVVVSAAAANGDRVEVHERDAQVVAALAPHLVWVVAAVGAALVGSELATGGISRQLCVEPRRSRVVVARSGAAAVAGALLTVATVGALELSFVLAAVLGPFHLDAGGGWVGTTVARALLAAVAGGGAGVLGACAAFVLRSTGSAIVATSAVVVAVDPLVEGAWAAAVGRAPAASLEAMLSLGAATSEQPTAASSGAAVVWVAAAVVGTTVLFDRRDVRDPG